MVRWIDLEAQTAENLELLRERFDFHPLALEDCLHLDQRPKLEEFDDVLFIVTHGFSCPEERVTKLDPHELHSFLGRGYLVTVHAEPLAELETAWKRVSQKPQLGTRGADFLYYLVADGMVHGANFPILDKIAEELELLTEKVLSTPRREHMARIFALKHELGVMRRAPQREVVVSVSKFAEGISERNSVYFRDMYYLVRIVEAVDSNRELLTNGMEAYLVGVESHQRDHEVSHPHERGLPAAQLRGGLLRSELRRPPRDGGLDALARAHDFHDRALRDHPRRHGHLVQDEALALNHQA